MGTHAFPGYVTPHWPRPGQPPPRAGAASRRVWGVDPRLSPAGYGRALRGDDVEHRITGLRKSSTGVHIFDVEAAIPSLERDSPLAAN